MLIFHYTQSGDIVAGWCTVIECWMRSTSVRVCCPSTVSECVWRHTQRGSHLAPCKCASVPSAKGRSSSRLLLGLCYVSCSPAAPVEAQLCTKLPCSPRSASTAAPLFLVFRSRKRAQTRTRPRFLSTQLERQGSLSGRFQLGPTHTQTQTYTLAFCNSFLLIYSALPQNFANTFCN